MRLKLQIEEVGKCKDGPISGVFPSSKSTCRGGAHAADAGGRLLVPSQSTERSNDRAQCPAHVDLRLPIQRQMIGIFDTRTWATMGSVGRTLSINRGWGRRRMKPSQVRRAYLGRRVTRTWNDCAGTPSLASIIADRI